MSTRSSLGRDLTATAHCIGRCGWTAGPGDPAAVDRDADKHTRGGHPTATVCTGRTT